jgi:hypothetical protein
MHHLAGLKRVRMAETAEAARIGRQKIRMIAGVGLVAGRAAGLNHRMHCIPTLQPGTMTLETKSVLLPGKLSMTAGIIRLMTEPAVPARRRCVYNGPTFDRIGMTTRGKAIVARQNTGSRSKEKNHNQIEK